jgi:hypothetical protein
LIAGVILELTSAQLFNHVNLDPPSPHHRLSGLAALAGDRYGRTNATLFLMNAFEVLRGKVSARDQPYLLRRGLEKQNTGRKLMTINAQAPKGVVKEVDIPDLVAYSRLELEDMELLEDGVEEEAGDVMSTEEVEDEEQFAEDIEDDMELDAQTAIAKSEKGSNTSLT